MEHAGSTWVKVQLLYHVLGFEVGLRLLFLGLNTGTVPGTSLTHGSWASWVLPWPLVLMTGSPLPGTCFSTVPSAPSIAGCAGAQAQSRLGGTGSQEGIERSGCTGGSPSPQNLSPISQEL